MTFKDWCYKYINDYKAISLKRSTLDSYLRYCNHIDITKDITGITVDDIQAVVTKMYSGGLKRSTINHTLTIIRQAIKKAYSLGYLKQVPNFELLEMPQCSRGVVEALTEKEVTAVINGPNCFYKDLFLFVLYTGCRIGEVIALTWADVDLKNCLLYINNTDYHGELQTNKSKRSRVLPITTAIKSILLRHRFLNAPRVFLNKDCSPCNYYTVRDAWTTYCYNIGIKSCGLHALRHTFATLAIRAGANIKAVSQLLGHSDVNITLNIYTDISPEQKQAAMCSLEKLFANSAEFANVHGL